MVTTLIQICGMTMKFGIGLFLFGFFFMFIYIGGIIFIADPIYYIITKKHLDTWNDIWKETKDRLI